MVSSAEAMLAIGLKLQDELAIRDIVTLWIDGVSQRESLDAMLFDAYRQGKIKGRIKGTQFAASVYFDVMIHRNDFLAWLEREGIPKPARCRLAKWWEHELTADSENTKRNQIAQEWILKNKISDDDLNAMRSEDILKQLEAFRPSAKNLFLIGGVNWLNRDHSVIPKRKTGSKKRK